MSSYNYTRVYKRTGVQEPTYTYTFKDGYVIKSQYGPTQYGTGQLDYLAHAHGGGYTIKRKVYNF